MFRRKEKLRRYNRIKNFILKREPIYKTLQEDKTQWNKVQMDGQSRVDWLFKELDTIRKLLD